MMKNGHFSTGEKIIHINSFTPLAMDTDDMHPTFY
jgi:hypothetical protein